MAYSYPIWHDVDACHYKSSKSWGGKNTSVDRIRVGSSLKNSELLGEVITTRRFFEDEKLGPVCVFKLSVDQIVLKEVWFKDNKGKAGEFLFSNSKLGQIK